MVFCSVIKSRVVSCTCTVCVTRFDPRIISLSDLQSNDATIFIFECDHEHKNDNDFDGTTLCNRSFTCTSLATL